MGARCGAPPSSADGGAEGGAVARNLYGYSSCHAVVFKILRPVVDHTRIQVFNDNGVVSRQGLRINRSGA